MYFYKTPIIIRVVDLWINLHTFDLQKYNF